jgi:hypothetical protein
MPSSKNLADLSPGEQQALCDWIAQQFGGYHSRGVCIDAAGGGLQGPVNQSGCLDQLPNYARCGAAVAQLQACIQAEVRDACSTPTGGTPPECALFSHCGLADGGSG